MYCKDCGKPLAGDVSFGPHCGAAVEASTAEAQDAASGAPTVPVAAPGQGPEGQDPDKRPGDDDHRPTVLIVIPAGASEEVDNEEVHPPARVEVPVD